MLAKLYEITYDDPAIGDNNRWSVFVNFRIIGENEKIAHAHTIYTLVCSSEYQKNPVEEPVDTKTVVLPFLDKNFIEKYIHKKIDIVNESHEPDWDSYYSRLEKWFYVDN